MLVRLRERKVLLAGSRKQYFAEKTGQPAQPADISTSGDGKNGKHKRLSAYDRCFCPLLNHLFITLQDYI